MVLLLLFSVLGPGIDRTPGLSQGTVLMAAEKVEVKPPGEKARFTVIVEKYGIALAILFSFWWGLLANVGSACIYPMVPITIGYFASQAETRGRGYTILLAWMYVLGIATLYAPLGVLSALAGRDVGALLGNPFFVGPFVAFLVALALSMFGLYDIKIPDFIMSRLQSGGRKTGIIGTFLMGVILGFIAAPCVGPFAASILGFVATTGSIPIGLASLFFFSLGLGMPYLALAISAKTLAGIPRAGEWMIRVKQFAGLALFLVAVYFMSPVVPKNVSYILAGMIVVFIGVFLGTLSWREASTQAIFGRGAGILIVIFGAMVFFVGISGMLGLSSRVPVLQTASRPAEEIQWVTPADISSFDERLRLAKEAGRPVFIDFYADWCAACKDMEVKIWGNEGVIKESKRFVTIKLDCSREDSPYTKLRIERFKSFAMPFVAFFDSKGNYLQDKAVEGETSPKEFLNILQQVQ